MAGLSRDDAQLVDTLKIFADATAGDLDRYRRDGFLDLVKVQESFRDVIDAAKILQLLLNRGVVLSIDAIDAIERLTKATTEIEELISSIQIGLSTHMAKTQNVEPEFVVLVSTLKSRSAVASQSLSAGLENAYRVYFLRAEQA